MAAFYANEEEEIWKCTQHPHNSSKRRRCTGICPFCLIDRLSALCPDCATTRPCPCSTTTTTTSTTSSSSVFSLDFLDDEPRISTLIDIEPPFSSSSRRRSSSSSTSATTFPFPFFRSARYPTTTTTATTTMNSDTAAPTSSFWSLFRRRKSPAPGEKMTRSKSVADVAPAAKGKGWYFPSPMKVFRHSKASKVAHQRSPLHRG